MKSRCARVVPKSALDCLCTLSQARKHRPLAHVCKDAAIGFWVAFVKLCKHPVSIPEADDGSELNPSDPLVEVAKANAKAPNKLKRSPLAPKKKTTPKAKASAATAKASAKALAKVSAKAKSKAG